MEAGNDLLLFNRFVSRNGQFPTGNEPTMLPKKTRIVERSACENKWTFKRWNWQFIAFPGRTKQWVFTQTFYVIAFKRLFFSIQYSGFHRGMSSSSSNVVASYIARSQSSNSELRLYNLFNEKQIQLYMNTVWICWRQTRCIMTRCRGATNRNKRGALV